MKKKIFSAFTSLFLLSTSGLIFADDVNPYNLRYSTIEPAPVHKSMSQQAEIIKYVDAGTQGILLRWCIPEFPFGAFSIGNSEEKRIILNERICEAILNGEKIYIQGRYLYPELN